MGDTTKPTTSTKNPVASPDQKPVTVPNQKPATTPSQKPTTAPGQKSATTPGQKSATHTAAKAAASTTVAKNPPHALMTLRQRERRRKNPLPKIDLADAEIVSATTSTPAALAKAATATQPAASRPSPTPPPQQPTSAKTTINQQSTGKENMQLPKIRLLYIKARYIVLAVIVCLLAAFVARVAIWEHNYLLAKEGSERDVVISEVYEGGDEAEIDDTEPTEIEIAEYHVAADRPRYLTIRSLGLYNVRIIEIGLKDTGELDVPYNIYNVGWYVGSSLPGAAGVSIMDAHGGDLGYGIFRNLPKIGLGDEIDIEMGDEITHYIYQVHDVAAIPLGEEANAYMASTAVHSPVAGTPSLTLITCTGDWLLSSQTYSQRLFVRATLVQ